MLRRVIPTVTIAARWFVVDGSHVQNVSEYKNRDLIWAIVYLELVGVLEGQVDNLMKWIP